MPTFNNPNELFKYLQNEIADSLKNEVTEIVKEVEQEAIQEQVYDRYNIVGGRRKDPYVYQRRMGHGGLSDPNNMVQVVQIVGDEVVLEVTNITKGQQDSNLYVADLVEYGDGSGGEYDFKNNRDGTAYQYLNPRPFTEETIKRLEASGVHVNALRNSLKRKGFIIE